MNSVHGPSPYINNAYIQDETLGTGELSTPSSPSMKTFEPHAAKEPLSQPLQVSRVPPSFDTTLPPLKTGLLEPPLISGDAQLLAQLGGGKDPELYQRAQLQSLPALVDECDSGRWHGHPRSTPEPDGRGRIRGREHGRKARHEGSMNDDSLTELAAGALHQAALVPPTRDSEPRKLPTIDIHTSTQRLSIYDDRSRDGDEPSDVERGRSASIHSGGHSGGLPPIVSPNSEGSGRSLPSIHMLPGMGNIGQSPSHHDPFVRSPHGASYPQSPPPHLPPPSASHGSPPISPPDSLQRNLPSPNSLSTSSPYGRFANTHAPPLAPGFGPTPPGPEPTGNEQDSQNDERMYINGTYGREQDSQNDERMYINGTYGSITQQATYQCEFSGCKAPPFQTQYLLNSHANVHSQARPHYCPVAGCARSEGGKGFKRKNEMIRHGLVHESPGYICPFCPEKDHRYPRPDNLQRHVRVHHTDKNKDDAQLREVLAQRPDGPNRGRRRRGGA